MDKLQVISQIIFDSKLMIFMTMTLGLLKDKLSIDKVNLEFTKRAFFRKGLPFLITVCSFVPQLISNESLFMI